MVLSAHTERRTSARLPHIVGILNITEDSFSDGGRYLEWEKSRSHIQQLLADGADIIEFGAVSSNPDAGSVTPEVELSRLKPAIAFAQEHSIRFAVDSCSPEIQAYAAAEGAELINDISGFPLAAQQQQLVAHDCGLVVMHAMQQGEKAERRATTSEAVLSHLYAFFEDRVAQLLAAGVRKERIILDPGMGFFLSSEPEPSIAALQEIPRLRAHFGCEIFISVSRKSFLRRLCGVEVSESAIPTLVAELYAARAGARFIRTHEPKQLGQGLLLESHLGALPET